MTKNNEILSRAYLSLVGTIEPPFNRIPDSTLVQLKPHTFPYCWGKEMFRLHPVPTNDDERV